MARQPVATGATSPGRFLAVLAIVIIALGAWMGLTGNHKPKLGLDLQGGTSVTLIPQIANGQGQVTNALIDQAIDIIRQRVNGSGVAEAEITRQGSGSNATIVVSVPGKDQGDLLDKVNQTAQLTFRPVLQEGAGVPASSLPLDSPTTSASPTRIVVGEPVPHEHRQHVESLRLAHQVRLFRRSAADAGVDGRLRLTECIAQRVGQCHDEPVGEPVCLGVARPGRRPGQAAGHIGGGAGPGLRDHRLHQHGQRAGLQGRSGPVSGDV